MSVCLGKEKPSSSSFSDSRLKEASRRRDQITSYTTPLWWIFNKIISNIFRHTGAKGITCENTKSNNNNTTCWCIWIFDMNRVPHNIFYTLAKEDPVWSHKYEPGQNTQFSTWSIYIRIKTEKKVMRSTMNVEVAKFEAALGSHGYESGGGITQLSPLK